MPAKAVIVFSFDEPEDSPTLAHIIDRCKKAFYDREGVKAALANGEAATKIIGFLYPTAQEESVLVSHAKKELARIANDEDFNNSIIKAIEGFVSYGHSGGSAPVAIAMINDLLQCKNLTPLTDDPKEWNHLHGEEGVEVWQSTRNSEAFSNDGGKTYYLLSEGARFTKPIPSHESEKS